MSNEKRTGPGDYVRFQGANQEASRGGPVEQEKWSGKGAVLMTSTVEVDFPNLEAEFGGAQGSTCSVPIWIAEPVEDQFERQEDERHLAMSRRPHPDQRPQSRDLSGRLADFVVQCFVPEYVVCKRLAGRAHFQAILKHILTPALVDRAFKVRTDPASIKLTKIHGWPYLDNLSLHEVTPEAIQHLISAAMMKGYSTQMAAHIRNVACAIFAHAIKSGAFTGTNPAIAVVLPAMARKRAHTLTLSQLKQVLQWMRYPEREIALFVMLTNMNVSEICGLRWKYLNLSTDRHLADGSRIPPRTMAVWNQSYRGEFGPVLDKRKRFIPIPDALFSTLDELKRRERFTTAEDFVLASRTGTPISPDNIAARRLKSIGKALDMPWLSWNVFHRTQVALKATFGRHWLKEVERILPHNSGPTRSN
jgi:site-specific recombinase XerD